MVTLGFKKRQNTSKASLKHGSKLTEIFDFLGDKLINISSIENSN